MISAVFFSSLLIVRIISFRYYIYVSLVTFLTFPEYLYVFDIVSIQKLIAVLFIFDAARIIKADFSVISKVTFGILIFFFIAIVSSSLSSVYAGVWIRSISLSLQYLAIYFFITAIMQSKRFYLNDILSVILIAFVLNLPFVGFEQISGQTLGEILAPFSNFENTGWDFVGKEKLRLDNVRSQGLLVHPLALAILSVFAVVAARVKFKLVASPPRLFGINPFYVFVIMALIVINFTGSRSGLLALVVVLMGMMGTSKYFIHNTVLVFGAITCFLLFDVFFDLGFVTLILDLFYGRGDYSALGNSNSVRLMQFYESLDAFVLSPLWGSGTDSAIYFMTYYTIDNFWLSLLVNFGLLGILVFLYLCLLLFSRGFLYAGGFFFYFFLMFFTFSLVISLGYLFMSFCFILGIFNSMSYLDSKRRLK